ncbi:MAG: methyl-accepting chemotaxis protein [Spirochaetales bacterium]
MSAKAKLLVAEIAVYLIGGLIWGVSIWYLGYIDVRGFLHIFSSAAVLIVPIFFVTHHLVHLRQLRIIHRYRTDPSPENLRKAHGAIRFVLLFSVLMIPLWGFLGPLSGFMSLYRPEIGFLLDEPVISLRELGTVILFGQGYSLTTFVPFVMVAIGIVEREAGDVPVDGAVVLRFSVKMSVAFVLTSIGTVLILLTAVPGILANFSSTDTVELLIRRLAPLGIFAILVAIFNLVMVTRQLATPIGSLIQVFGTMFRNIDRGEADLTPALSVASKDELGVVSYHVSRFVEYIAATIRQVQETARSSVAVSTKLNDTAQEFSNAIEKLVEQMDTVASSSGSLDAQLGQAQESSATLTRFAGSLRESTSVLASSVEESSASVTQMTSSIQSISDTVSSRLEISEQLRGIANTGSQTMQEAAETLSKVSESTGVMTDAIGVIETIAAQTNLLAMNAAIEAAHAGEHGKGFAVVADEIRKLAETSSENSAQISSSLKKVAEYIERSSSATRSMDESFTRIVELIGQVTDSMLEIQSGTAELASGSQEISQTVSLLVDTTDGVRQSSLEVDGSVQTIEGALSRLREVSVDTRKRMESMKTESREAFSKIQGVTESAEGSSRRLGELAALVSKVKTKEASSST